MNFSLQTANTLISVLTRSKSISDVTSMLTAVLMECQTQIGSVRSFRPCGVKSLTTCLFISRLPVDMRPAAFWVNLEVSLWLTEAMCQISHIHRDIYPQKLTLAFTHQLVCKHAKKRSPLLPFMMSTEIKLVYYFQRGKKITQQKASLFFTLVIIKFVQPFSLHYIKK